MKRSTFLKTLGFGAMSISTLSAFNRFTDALPEDGQLMPALFIGHGSPMNAIEDNVFTQEWKALAREIPVPKAVLVISAHWLTRGTKITAMAQPRTIHDFGGFPQALFDVQYPAPGQPALAAEIAAMLAHTPLVHDHEWGLDHGAWSVVKVMYPEADIPVLQLSIDWSKGAQYHYDLARELAPLRKKGVLLLGSGNMVHNLGMINWEMIKGGGYDWALSMNDRFKNAITSGDAQALIHFERFGREGQLAIPTPDHYYPLLYTMGLQTSKDAVTFFNDQAVGGSLTMTSVKLG